MNPGRIDWTAAKRKLAEAERAVAAALVFDETRMRELLGNRARRLAARRNGPAPAQDARPVMVFLLGQERYAAGLEQLSRVAVLEGLAPVPGAPEAVLGVMNFRGEAGTVWDLARLLDLPGTQAACGGHVLVLKAAGAIGLRVDYAEGRQELDAGGMLLPREAESALPLRFLKGLTRDNIRLLDLEAVLQSLSELADLGVSHNGG